MSHLILEDASIMYIVNKGYFIVLIYKIKIVHMHFIICIATAISGASNFIHFLESSQGLLVLHISECALRLIYAQL